ncbi:MAG: zf-TFIIB domain-containing protein [Pyrinomonadaceae bacterium]
MSEIFDERRKALEEEYFRRRDRESLRKLREALHDEARERGEAASTMACPRCDGMLHEETYDDVHIDRCNSCNGIWLDAGELEQIIKQENPTGRWLSVFWPGDASERNVEG